MIPRFGRADVLAVLLFLLVSVHYAVASITLAASAPLWMDEVLAVRTARLTDPAAIWHALVHGAEFSPPLYDMLLGRLHALGVDTPIGWRLPSIVAGYAAAIALGSIAWRRYGRVPAALAAGIVLSSGLFAYAVQARPYALLIAVFALALAIRERPAGAQPSPRRCALLALLLVVMVALHFYALLLVAVLVAIELAERRPPSRGVLAASAVAAASIAAWLPILVAAHHYSGADTGAPGYYARPTLDALLSSYALTLGWPALLLLGLLIIVALRRARALPVPVPALGLLTVPLVVFAFALLVSHSFTDRYVVSAALGAGLLAAWLVARLDENRRAIGLVALALLVPGNDAGRWGGEIAKRDRLDALDAVARVPGNAPIVTGSGLRFLEMAENARPEIARRLVYLDTPDIPSPDPTNRNQVLRWAAIDPRVRVAQARAFTCAHPALWLFAQPGPGGADTLPDWFARRFDMPDPPARRATVRPVRMPYCRGQYR